MDAVIGEPEREEILAMSSLRWIQITWAGADKYMRMKDVLSGITLTNVSGAFGTIIAEYVNWKCDRDVPAPFQDIMRIRRSMSGGNVTMQ